MPRGNVTVSDHVKKAESQIEQALIKVFRSGHRDHVDPLMDVLNKLKDVRETVDNAAPQA